MDLFFVFSQNHRDSVLAKVLGASVQRMSDFPAVEKNQTLPMLGADPKLLLAWSPCFGSSVLEFIPT
jgi:hypothetical protein